MHVRTSGEYGGGCVDGVVGCRIGGVSGGGGSGSCGAGSGSGGGVCRIGLRLGGGCRDSPDAGKGDGQHTEKRAIKIMAIGNGYP